MRDISPTPAPHTPACRRAEMFSARFCPKWIPEDRWQSVEFIPRRDYGSPWHRAACQQPSSSRCLASSVHIITAPASPGTTLLLHCNIHEVAAFLLLRRGETGPKVGWQRISLLFVVHKSPEAAPEPLLRAGGADDTKPWQAATDAGQPFAPLQHPSS